MRKAFKKLFSSSSIDGIGDKASKKLQTPRNKISVPSLQSHVRLESNSLETDALSGSTVVEEDRGISSQLDGCKKESAASSLDAAVSEGNLELVKKLIANGANDESIDENGLTPFLKAVKIGNIQLVRIMAQRNKLQTDADGNTALHIAVKEEFLRIAEILVSLDPLVNVPNKAGDLPLHIAVRKECFSIVELLLRSKAVMDVEDSQKRTPLFIALKLENVPLIQLLLKYGAHRNDHSIISCLSSLHNPKIKSLFRFLDCEEKTSKSCMNDDDSQNSELFVLPPVLDSPRSWNILHPKNNIRSKRAEENTLKLLPHKRRKHFSKAAEEKVAKSYKTPSNKSDSLNIDEKAIEDCKKALVELSLQVSQGENLDTSDELNGFAKSAKTSSLPTCDSVLNEMKFLKNYEINQDSPKDAQSSVKFTDEFSSSSEEEPLIWENSNDGGYFTEWSRSSKLSDANEIEDRSKSSTSDEDLDNFHHNKVYSVMLNSLKQITQENKDLETESAVLRESVEKLKYDLANSREDLDTEKITSSSLTSHLTNFDEKYLKAVENVGTSQLYISNLEMEISHLKRTYNESCKMNRFLAKELRKALADIALIKSTNCRTCERNSTDINELQIEIAEWKTKYDDLAQHYVTTSSSNSHFQEAKDKTESLNEMTEDIMKEKLLLEVTKLNSILKYKEVKEEQLKNQVQELHEEIRKSKSEKRNMLIKKTFRDKYSSNASKRSTKDAKVNLDLNWN